MIQRIQTLYLTIALGLMISMFWSIYATHVPFVVLTAAVCLLICAAIVLFKARKIQIRICLYTSIVLVFDQIWIGVAYFQNMDHVTFSITTVFPIVCAILLIMALRAIGADEAMVQSYERLRPTQKEKLKEKKSEKAK